MLNQFSRTQLLVGADNMNRFFHARVAVFGIGGVGGYVVEALARTGIGTLDLIDDDKICLTNLNRQVLALRSSVGKDKVDVAEERIHQINPRCVVNKHKTFYMPDTADQFDFTEYDYVADCIDTVTGKIMLIEQALKAGVPIISCMGAGNKMDASAFRVADISQTKVCPLAKVMRRELKKRGITHLKVVYSEEKPLTPISDMEISCREHCICPPGTKRKCTVRRAIPGSNAFVPAAAGLIMAGEIVKDLMVPVERTKEQPMGVRAPRMKEAQICVAEQEEQEEALIEARAAGAAQSGDWRQFDRETWKGSDGMVAAAMEKADEAAQQAAAKKKESTPA